MVVAVLGKRRTRVLHYRTILHGTSVITRIATLADSDLLESVGNCWNQAPKWRDDV